jgi:hypothetical protein
VEEIREVWLPVPGYAGWYEVSNLGNVASLARETTRGKLLKPQLTQKGYRQVGLSKYGKVRFHRISNLVLEAFTGPRPPDHQACHGPGGKMDDRLVNLSWGTPSRNQLDRRRDGTSNQGERGASAVLTAEIVLECRRRYAAGESQAILCREFGVTSGAMSSAIKGRTWAHLTEGIPEDDGRSRPRQDGFSEKMRAAGRKGAEARWHPGG